MPEAAYTTDEMMTIAAARMIRNGATLFVGSAGFFSNFSWHSWEQNE